MSKTFALVLVALLTALAPQASAAAQDAPAAIRIVGQAGGIITSVVSDGSRVFALRGPRLVSLQPNSTGQLDVLGQSQPLGRTDRLARAGDKLFVAGTAGGLRVVDMSDPAAPRAVADDVSAPEP